MDDFLSTAIEPPCKSVILQAVTTLKLINVLDKDERLTLLGRKIVDLSTHPRLSVCIVTAAMTGCFNEMVRLAAMMSQTKDPFYVMPGYRGIVRWIKKDLTGKTMSDHHVLHNLLRMFENRVDGAQSLFNRYSEFMDFETLRLATHLKKMYIQELADKGIEDANEGLDSSNLDCLFDLSLLSGLYPNVLKSINEGGNSQKSQLINVVNGLGSKYSSESILYKPRIENETFFTAIYFNSFYSENRRRLMIVDASLIPSVHVLFACKNLRLVKEDGPMITFTLDDCKYLVFTMDRDDLGLILKWKDIFNVYQKWYLCNNMSSLGSSNYTELKETLNEFLDVTTKVFESCKNAEITVKESFG